MEKEPTESILGRLLAELQCYRFKVKNVKNANNQADDALSQLENSSAIAALAAAERDPEFPTDF